MEDPYKITDEAVKLYLKIMFEEETTQNIIVKFNSHLDAKYTAEICTNSHLDNKPSVVGAVGFGTTPEEALLCLREILRFQLEAKIKEMQFMLDQCEDLFPLTAKKELT